MLINQLITLDNEEVHNMIMKAINFDPTNHKVVGLIPCVEADGCWTLEIKIASRSLPLSFELEN